jgi:hypothetical protein
MADGLTAFLTARLDEDEATARDVRYVWPTSFEVTLNPARVLREVAAKRARLALWLQAVDKMDPMLADDDADPVERAVVIGRVQAAREAVMLDVAVYSDHPDYHQEWAPAPATISP